MDSRKNRRFAAAVSADETAVSFFIEIDIDKDETVKASVFDISLGGIAAEMPSLTDEQKLKIEQLKDFFIRLHYKDMMFLIGVEPAWSIFKKDEAQLSFKGGFRFDLISDADRLKLSDLIEELRSAEYLV